MCYECNNRTETVVHLFLDGMTKHGLLHRVYKSGNVAITGGTQPSCPQRREGGGSKQVQTSQ